MFLKRRVRKKDGKEHVHYALCESLRVHSGRVVQRQVPKALSPPKGFISAS